MSANTPIDLLLTLVAQEHANGIFCYVLKLEAMCQRVNAVAERYNHGNPASPTIYRGFVESCYREGQYYRPYISLVPNAIAFYAGQESPSMPSRFAYTHVSNTNRLYYILDVETNDLFLIVPLGRDVLYTPQVPECFDGFEPVPFWVIGSKGLGVPVGGSNILPLQHGDMYLRNPDGCLEATMDVKIDWPGYEPGWVAQIQMRWDGHRPGDSHTFRRLVNQVRGKIREFIMDHAEVATRDLRWAVGSAAHGRINAEDLTLLAIVAVSPGKVMPILKLRDDFEFSTSAV